MDKPMIGIFLPSMALDTSKIKYSVKFIQAFDRKEYADQVVIFVYGRDMPLIHQHVNYLEVRDFSFGFFRKAARRLSRSCNLSYVEDFIAAINKHHISFAVFPTPQDRIVDCKIPYAASFQSLGHRLNPELPEFGQEVWKSREDIYATVCKDAKLILIDSDTGKGYLDSFYDPSANMIVIPHTVPYELDIDVDQAQQESILKKFRITKSFLFYPAQLWPHKNHVRVFEAIRVLKKRGLDLQVVFTGSSESINHQYNTNYILRRMAQDYDMHDNLVITGYLNNEEMKTFYQKALAMIMPQLIPEPCIPYVEAMGLGCPVIAPDIPGIKEQMNGAGVMVDPYDIASIARGIESLGNADYRSTLIKKGIANYNLIEEAADTAFSLVRDSIIRLAKG